MEAINAVIEVVDVDLSDLFDCIRWNHKCMVSWKILVSLSRLGTIGQDEVEVPTFTILPVVLKANQGMNLSTCNHIIHLSMSWKEKHFFAATFAAYYL